MGIEDKLADIDERVKVLEKDRPSKQEYSFVNEPKYTYSEIEKKKILRFRFQRSSFKDSLSTMVHIKNLENFWEVIEKHLNEVWSVNINSFDPLKLNCIYQGFDHRSGWFDKSYLISLMLAGGECCALGQSNFNLNELD